MDTRVITLQVPASTAPAFTRAEILPDRGMMTLQLGARLAGRGELDLLASPPLAEALARFERSASAFPGNESFYFGGAVLVPFANRIRGRLSSDGRTVTARILGREVALPANFGGAERYAMHGLILDSRATEVEQRTAAGEDAVRAVLQAGDFGCGWPSRTEMTFENVLRADAFHLTVTARNVGDEILPMGIGWHPYFALPGGRREAARLRVPARRRVLVNGDVLPTGEVEPVAGTPYDFARPGGQPLGDLRLDDCFVDLETAGGEVICEVIDPAVAYGLRVAAVSPPVRAIQVYAPLDGGFVAIEPQLNWADPFGAQWEPGVDTGMALLEPGESVTYSVRLEVFVP